MGLGKIGELSNNVGFDNLKFEIQIPCIWASMELGIEDIGYDIFEADLTYMA